MLHHDYYLPGNTCLPLPPTITKIPQGLCLYWSPWPHKTDGIIPRKIYAWDRPNLSFGWFVVDKAQPCTLAPFTVILLTIALVLDQLGSWEFFLSQPHTAPWLGKRWGVCGKWWESLKLGNGRKSQEREGKIFYQLNWKWVSKLDNKVPLDLNFQQQWKLCTHIIDYALMHNTLYGRYCISHIVKDLDQLKKIKPNRMITAAA